MRRLVKHIAFAVVPPLRRVVAERDMLRARVRELEWNEGAAGGSGRVQSKIASYLDTTSAVLQYRRAYFEAHGHIAPGEALPQSRAWPAADDGYSYKEKLARHLDLSGTGAEIGPLNVPLLSKAETDVRYVDHLDTKGLREKYPTLSDLVDVDLPMVNDNLADTLRPAAPLNYLVASQVMEHVPNPIKWLEDAASALDVGGKVALSLPDRRLTFDLFREESRPAEVVAAFLLGHTVPSVQSVYDNQTLATAINMHAIYPDSQFPDEVVQGRGANSPRKAAWNPDHMETTRLALSGVYLDAHCWVFTPTSFLIMMAQLASDNFLPYRLHQFYPTNPKSPDRGSSSFIVVLERVSSDIDATTKRRSFLMPLGGDENR